MKHLRPVLFLSLLSPAVAAQSAATDWKQETAAAEWQPRDSQGEFVYDNHLWIMGGWFTPKLPNPRDVWKSADGVKWTRVTDEAPWIHSDLPASMVFRGRMWMMGGRKLPGSECSNQVWSSKNGKDWTLVNKAAPWKPRLAPGFVVFKNRMWLLGGTEDFYNNNDSTMMNDVWSSSDGKDWKLEVAEAPWAKRTHGQAVVFDGKIWVMGGGSRAPKASPRNDIWCSSDGRNWELVTESAPWPARLWFSAVVYRDHLWVLGGWSEKDGNYGDVWYSKDGKSWTEFKSGAIWSKRHEHAAFVFKDKIWVAGGAAEPKYKLDSEVWSLELPAGWAGK